MKTTKVLFIVLTVIVAEMCTNIRAMDMVSYHSALQEQKEHKSIALPKCDSRTEAKLRDCLNEVTRTFLKSSCATEKESVPLLIEECRKIFWGTNYSEEYAYYEDGEDIDSATEIVTSLFEGLPEAALKLQGFYEILGNVDRSFFWALVACKLGYESGAEAIGRLRLTKRM